MTNQHATWSPERSAILRKLWAEGLSASQIAKQLGGVTRNAVIGKVHRLGLGGTRYRPAHPYNPPRIRKPRAPRVRASRSSPRSRFQISPPAAPAPVYSDDPASRIAAALLSGAANAERRRDQYRRQHERMGLGA